MGEISTPGGIGWILPDLANQTPTIAPTKAEIIAAREMVRAFLPAGVAVWGAGAGVDVAAGAGLRWRSGSGDEDALHGEQAVSGSRHEAVRTSVERDVPATGKGFLLGRLKQYSLGPSTYDPAKPAFDEGEWEMHKR